MKINESNATAEEPMPHYDPARHRRRSIRLKGYDYRSAGAYFVTFNTQHWLPLFGTIHSRAMQLSDAGAMVHNLWHELPQRFPSVALDAWVVMPDHFHAILWLGVNSPVTLGTVIGTFKSLTTNTYIAGVRERGWTPFEHRVWQRDYYEHIVRNDRALARIRAYIKQNPARWRDRD